MKRDNRLYELRTSCRLTQIAVACKLNLSSSRVSAYENGDNIPCDVLKLFAEFYGVSIDYILCVSDDKDTGYCTNLRVPEKNLVDFYRKLAPAGKALIDGMIKGYTPPEN